MRRLRPRVGQIRLRVAAQLEDLDVAAPHRFAGGRDLVDGDRLDVHGVAAVEVADRFYECWDAGGVHGATIAPGRATVTARRRQIRPLPHVHDFSLSKPAPPSARSAAPGPDADFAIVARPGLHAAAHSETGRVARDGAPIEEHHVSLLLHGW